MQIKTETRVGVFILAALAIFFYMSFKVGVFRWDRFYYNSYYVYFDDVSGLQKKADVKIAGVKVGWVEDIELLPSERQAKAQITLLKEFKIYDNAYAIVRQEGLLGTKYLEIIPGDSLLTELHHGAQFGQMGRSPVSVDTILQKVQEIAINIEGVSQSFQEAIGTPEGKKNLKSSIENFAIATEKIANFSSSLDRTLSDNSEGINSMIADLRTFAQQMKETMPVISRLSEQVESDIMPGFRRDLEKITEAIEGAALQARDGFKSISSVAEKIDEGKGLIGKLINEEETYKDIKFAVRGVKNYFAKVDAIRVVFDSHNEFLLRPAEHFRHEDFKGYIDARIYPSDDYFYILGAVSTIKGDVFREEMDIDWRDEIGQPLLAADLVEQGKFVPELVGYSRRERRVRDTVKYNFQFGKIFGPIALRAGVIENYGGFGIDIDIPLGTDKCRWVTSLELFDWRGRNRIDDSRPHLKWINRVFVMRNMYVDFGADDFISRKNANAFFGGGVRFCDEDIKYLASSLGIMTSSGG